MKVMAMLAVGHGCLGGSHVDRAKLVQLLPAWNEGGLEVECNFSSEKAKTCITQNT